MFLLVNPVSYLQTVHGERCLVKSNLSNLKWLRTRFFSTAELAVNNQPLEFFLVVFLAIYLLTQFKAATDNCLGRT